MKNRKSKVLLVFIVFILITAIVAVIVISVNNNADSDTHIFDTKIVSQPNKLEYFFGEPFDFYGLIAEYSTSKGGEKLTADWNDDRYTIINYNSTLVGEQVVIIELLGEKLLEITVSVKPVFLYIYDNVLYRENPLIVTSLLYGAEIDSAVINDYLGGDEYASYDGVAMYSDDSWRNELTDTTINGNTTLYVEYYNNECELILNANGGYCAIDSLSLYRGMFVDILSTPTRFEHTFLGWSTKIDDVNFIIKYPYHVRRTETLYAIWAKL